MFRHNNSASLSFRKVLSSKTNKVSELAQDACTEVLDKNFVNIFASSVRDLAASKVAVELIVEKVECDVHQGDKVGSSAVGKLTRSKDNVIVNEFPEGVELMNKIRDMVKNFESNPANQKNMI